MWNQRSERSLLWLGILAGAVAGTTGCSSGGGSSATPITSGTVSGTLTQASASDVGDVVSKSEAAFATTGTTLSLDCGTAGTFTATVNPTTGAFSASGVPTGVPCSFNFVNSSTGVNKCQVQFQDSANYDLNHNQASANSSSISNSLALGSITCDTTGTVPVSVSSVSGLSSGANLAAATAFNMTGVWTAAAYTGTLPTGYQTITNCTQNCNGPAIGQVITLVRYHGVQFTPSAGQCSPAINVSCPVSAGTDNTAKEGYGMSIWGGNYAQGIGACGGMSGFTADEARAYANLDLDTTPPTVSGNTLTYGHYVWSTPSGFGTDTGWTQPWMYGGATSQYAVSDCQPASVPSTSGAAARAGMACFSQIQTNTGTATGVYVWSVGLQGSGGCVDSSGNPLMVNNWSNITTGTCTTSASAFNSNMTTNSCTYTAAPQAGATSQTFTCSNTFGTFNDISGSTGSGNNNGPNFSSPYSLPANNWPSPPSTVLAQGAACKNAVTSESSLITTATSGSATAAAAAKKELLYRYQCYANAYWQHSSNGAGNANSCARGYNFNWSTNNYANFVLGDDRSMKPQNAFITDRVFYSSDGTWAFLKNTDVRFQSIPTSTGSTLCPMNQVITMKIHEISPTQLQVNFVQQTTITDTSATCQGAVSAAMAGGGNVSPDPTGLNNLYQQLQTARMVFLMNKTSN